MSTEIQAKVLIFQRKQALQNEVERLYLEEELAVAQARESVFAQVEPEGTSEMKEEYNKDSEVTA